MINKHERIAEHISAAEDHVGADANIGRKAKAIGIESKYASTIFIPRLVLHNLRYITFSRGKLRVVEL